MDQRLKIISDVLIDRYNDRYLKLGKDVKTLGWGSSEQQRYRFSVSSTLIGNFEDKQVLDIGCGFGDYCLFLRESSKNFKSYTGIDINEKLILEAKGNVTGENINFYQFNLLEEDPKHLGNVDLAFMFGILNFNLKEKMDNFEYSKLFITRAFSLANEALVFDVISENRDPNYPYDDFIYYHNPLKLIEFCFSLTPFVSFLHDYQSIPQREMTIILSKKNRL